VAFWDSQGEYETFLKSVRTDSDRLADFALVYYRGFGSSTSIDVNQWDRLLLAISKMCVNLYAITNLDERRTIKKNLGFRGAFIEPSVFEDASIMANAHSILNQVMSQNGDPSLLELLLVAHDLEYILRPTLLRINWLIRRTDGEIIDYSRSQLNKKGEEGSLGYGIAQINEKLDLRRKHRILTKADKKEMRAFVQSFCPGKGFPLGAENLRNWIAHRDFFVTSSEVVMNFHPRPGKRFPLSKAQVSQTRFTTLGLAILCLTINAVFKIASEANVGIVKPELKVRKWP
jgi:hypothetical protein